MVNHTTGSVVTEVETTPSSSGGTYLQEQVVIFKKVLFKYWLLLATVSIVGVVSGFLIAHSTPVKYSARLTFVLEEGKASGGIGSLVGQLGVDLGGISGSSSLFAGDNIIGLLNSRKFVRDVLLTPYDAEPTITLADKHMMITGLRKKLKNIPDSGKIFSVGQTKMTRVQDSLLDVVSNQIQQDLYVARMDRRMGIFEVKTTMTDELLCKLFTERLVTEVADFYIETKTRRQRTNVERLQSRADSIAFLLNRQTYSAAAAQSRLLDINPAYQIEGVPAEVSGRDKVMVATIYGELVKNLEVQKATLTQDTPLLLLVDTAQMPLSKIQAGKLRWAFAMGILTFFITAIILFNFKKPVK